MGVKSLWSLLDPVGRPVLLETMEGKAMAIDSSIWIYQFQATMRDKEGRGLVNAHVVGFLRRICKLLFYGIKPVFVFDGGAPALKRSTISERKRKKSGAAASHAKVAERLLAAHMRRAALDHAQTQQSQTRRAKPGVPNGPVTLDENTVYLEDLEGPGPVTPAKTPQKDQDGTPASSKKKSRWHDHDPYRLPDVNMDDMVAKATRSVAPDPRLATEEELRDFIEDMKPGDFDVTSPAFRELPTEVQYEIIGDLRLKSRQTSYKRLQNMLKNAKTPLDFSKEQIKNLKQRNSLTQQLLTTTDSIGQAHVEIPVRIASERNKQYILIKNEGEAGGWILGVRDEGTRAKPIEIDQEDNKPVAVSDDSDEEMEEVPIAVTAPMDPDLRKHQRSEALSAIQRRYKTTGLAPLTTKSTDTKSSMPLFVAEDSDEDLEEVLDVQAADDAQLAFAIQESLENKEADDLRAAVEASKADALRRPAPRNVSGSNVGASTSRSTLDYTRLPQTPQPHASGATQGHTGHGSYVIDSDDELYASPTRLETVLSIANVGPRSSSATSPQKSPAKVPRSDFGVPVLLLSSDDEEPPQDAGANSDADMEEVAVIEAGPPASASIPEAPLAQPSPDSGPQANQDSDSDADLEEVTTTTITAPPPKSFSAPPEHLVEAETSNFIDPHPVVISNEHNDPLPNHEDSDDSDSSQDWSRPRTQTALNEEGNKQVEQHEDWDAAQEMDPHAEEGEYAQFLSQVRGKNLEEVRREIDEEIKALNQKNKVAMRDSEDITQQMISQIMMMLRLFGIPYITAPMEAEAQCAELLTLGLVDGIITDDSDVFLFGGMRVLRNMFNQSKTVECFLLSDLERELGLDREKLIRLAYLLGSDYTDGLPGVGPVVAMELLTEFSGPGGLHEFREWWRKVQMGKDSEEDTRSKFRKRFKKRFKDLYLPEDWPNAAVRDAYYHPTVDSSEEPFKWGLPDLDALRGFFGDELGWNQEKVDDLLLPIIRKMNKRTQAGTANQQSNLVSFFDVPAGGAAPRKRQAYASKRLQQVVSDFRKRQSAERRSKSQGNSSGSNDQEESDGEDEVPIRPQKKRKTSGEQGARGARGRGRGKGRGRGRGGASKRRPKDDVEDETTEESVSEGELPSVAEVLPVPAKPRPRPRPTYKQASDQAAAAEAS